MLLGRGARGDKRGKQRLAVAELSQGTLTGKDPRTVRLEVAAPRPGEGTHMRERKKTALQC